MTCGILSDKFTTYPVKFYKSEHDERFQQHRDRKIFNGTSLDEEELKIMARFREFLDRNNLRVDDSVFEGDYLALRCLKATKSDFQKCYTRIQTILE